MSYVALYRKFRPTDFSDVKGQDHIVTTLKNQLKTQRIGHAYLFTGTRGTGKTTMAKIFAKAVNCTNPTENGPCGECEMCRAIADGSNLNVVEIDAASNTSVDDVRNIIEEVSYRPTMGRYKVYIIDEVHMISPNAFNALLKTLEEPPEYVIFILATTDVHKILPTILSRCQRYDFRRISVDTIADRMKELMVKEEVEIDDKALRYIARKADGSLRDALSLLDQCIAFNIGHKLTYDRTLEVLGAVDSEMFSDLYRAVVARDVTQCVKLLDDVVAQGRELVQFTSDFTWYLRNIMMLQASPDFADTIDVSEENMIRLKEDAALAESDRVIRYIRIFSELVPQVRNASQKRIPIDIALVNLCKPMMEKRDDTIIDRISALEEKLENGVVVSSTVAAVPGGAKPAAKEEAPRVQMPKALREDVQYIVDNWDRLKGATEALSTMLATAIPSVDKDGNLEIVYTFGDISYGRITAPGRKEALAEVLSSNVGKEVTFNIREASSKNEKIFDIRQINGFPIEEDDE